VLERDYRDYIYQNPHLLFPNDSIQMKQKEVYIDGKFVDLLFQVQGTQYIIELKRDRIGRDAIGQVMEYYGLMLRRYGNRIYKMMLVAPSIPDFRRLPLEVFGIQCIEIALPAVVAAREPVINLAERSERRESSRLEPEVFTVPQRVEFSRLQPPCSRQSMVLAQTLLRDGLQGIEREFKEYEIRPVKMVNWSNPGLLYFPEISGLDVTQGGAWWAYSFGPLEQSAKNDVPNISVNALPWGLDVAVNAELQRSQAVMLAKIGSAPEVFDKRVAEHGALQFQAWFKLELQPRIYRWVLVDQKDWLHWDAAYILNLHRRYEDDFFPKKAHWKAFIEQHGPKLTDEQNAHMSRMNQRLNLCFRLVDSIRAEDHLWTSAYDEQVRLLDSRYRRLKPLIEFFQM
jgi:hypothetical protein